MKVTIVYIFAATSPRYDDYASRFLYSYIKNPTDTDHDSIVVVNGAKPTTEIQCRFGALKNLSLFYHDNSGWDIGAFQNVARNVQSDLMVFFGSTSYIKGYGWLDRMVQAYNRHGNHLYGSMGNQGGGPVHAHIRTVGFWMNPKLFNEYPVKVNRLDQRYPFEHGPNNLTKWIWKQKRRAFVATWVKEYEYPNWDKIPNGFHRGNQSALLTGDRLADPPFYYG